MATLTRSSTLEEINAAYDDNSSYHEDGSTAKAAAFITACRFLLRRTAKRAVDGRSGREMEHETRLLREEIEAADRWLARQSGSGGTPGSGGTGQTRYFGSAHDFRD